MADRSVLRCTVIENPAAGQWTAALAGQVARRCARYAAAVRTVRTSSRGDTAGLARAAVRATRARARGGGTYHVIIALGGDGTVYEVARGMLAAGARADTHALFVVPAGTGNSGYRSYWGDRGWTDALDEALTAPRDRARMLDLARITELDEIVVLGAGAGLSAEVLARAPDDTLTGAARLQARLDRAIAGYQPYPGRVLVDGAVIHEGRTVFVNVGGGPHRAWQYLLLPYSVLDDGLLDVCVVDHGVTLDSLLDMVRAGRHVGAPGVVYRRGRHVVIERHDGRPLSFEHDGELVARAGSRVSLEVLPGALPVLRAAGEVAPAGHDGGTGLAAA